MSDAPPDLFISYSRDDQDKVIALAQRLRQAGVSVWIDQGSIDAAALWSEQIVRALDSAKALLLMVSKASVGSDNVAKEVMLFSERKGHILPVHLEPTVLPPTLKYPLAGIQHIEFYAGDPEEKLQAILRALGRIGISMRAAREPAATPSPAPAPLASTSADPAAAGAAHGALAVLPFENMSPDPEADYFSDGLTEELIARLSLVSGIELVSRWASMQFKGRKQDARSMGAELGARYIIGGSVRKQQESVRITVQLVDVETNRQLWGNLYKGELADIFDIQEQVAQQVVEALKLKLSFTEKLSLTKRSTVNAQAYDLYLRGQDHLYRLTRRGVEYSIQLFEKAIELDPRYAAAYAGCSSAYGWLYQWCDRDNRYREKAQEMSFKALMYDSNLAEAYAAMGLSYFLWGKYEESSASCRKAIELDPDDFIAYWTLGRIHFSAGNLQPALELFRKVTKLRPQFYAAIADLAQTCEGLGLDKEADEARDQLLAMLPMYLLRNPDDARARLYYAVALAEVGQKEAAVQEGQKAVEANPGDTMMLYNLACLYAELGEKARAIDSLRRSIEGGYQDFGWMQHDPDLGSLRDMPEFQALQSFARPAAE